MYASDGVIWSDLAGWLPAPADVYSIKRSRSGVRSTRCQVDQLALGWCHFEWWFHAEALALHQHATYRLAHAVLQ